MQDYSLWIQLLSIVLFFSYGSACIFVDSFSKEFERYGMEQYRIFIGIAELLGALGLIVGFFLPPLTFFAALGLSILMLGAVFTRIRIGDSFIQSLPAVFCLGLNLLIVFLSKDYM